MITPQISELISEIRRDRGEVRDRVDQVGKSALECPSSTPTAAPQMERPRSPNSVVQQMSFRSPMFPPAPLPPWISPQYAGQTDRYVSAASPWVAPHNPGNFLGGSSGFGMPCHVLYANYKCEIERRAIEKQDQAERETADLKRKLAAAERRAAAFEEAQYSLLFYGR